MVGVTGSLGRLEGLTLMRTQNGYAWMNFIFMPRWNIQYVNTHQEPEPRHAISGVGLPTSSGGPLRILSTWGRSTVTKCGSRSISNPGRMFRVKMVDGCH